MPSVASATKLGRDLADRDHVVAPIVDAEQPLGHAGEHALQLPLGHGRVRAQGRHDVGQPIAEIVVGDARQRAGYAVGPGEIGRQGQHLSPRLQSPKRLGKGGAKFLGRQVRCGRALGVEGGHNIVVGTLRVPVPAHGVCGLRSMWKPQFSLPPSAHGCHPATAVAGVRNAASSPPATAVAGRSINRRISHNHSPGCVNLGIIR